MSEKLRTDIEQWWQIGYGTPGRDFDDDGYEAITRDLASRLQDELGPDWEVTWRL